MAIDVSPKIAAMTREMRRMEDVQPAPVSQPPAQDPKADLGAGNKVFHDTSSFLDYWIRSKTTGYNTFTDSARNSAGALNGTVTVDGRDGSIDLRDNNGNHAHVLTDGTTTLDGGGQNGTQKIAPGTVLQVGDAKVRFNFDYPAGDNNVDHARITSVDMATASGVRNVVDGDGKVVDQFVRAVHVATGANGTIDVQGNRSDSTYLAIPDRDAASGSDGGHAVYSNANALSSAPALFDDAHHNTMIRDPEVRLGPGALFALPQVGTAGGKLEPGALTLNHDGSTYNKFTSLLDPSKIDNSQQLP